MTLVGKIILVHTSVQTDYTDLFLAQGTSSRGHGSPALCNVK